jgi:NADH-quinone oxidoreductase subunit J
MTLSVSHVAFVLLGAVSLLGAVGAVTDRNLFRAAMFLVLSFIGVAGLYILLEVEILAMIQLLLYVGAISVLIIFAIMLSRQLMSPDYQSRNEQWLIGLVAAIGLFAVLAFVLLSVSWPVSPSEVPPGAIAALGYALVSPNHFVLVFEVASVLLLVALVGSVIIARER